METFKKGEKIGKYVINSFIKKGIVAESYSVLGPDDMMYFMKVYDIGSIPHEQLFEGKEVYEIQLCKELNTSDNANVVRYVDNGEVRKGNTVYHYLVTEFYRGMLLLDAVRQDGRFDLEDAVQITLCVLGGLAFIHSCALIHNDIRPSNIMLQELEDGMLMPTIIDLGHISYMVKGRPTFADEDLMPYFRAPETFRAVYTVKSDIFSTGALLYFLIFGKSPWEDMDLRELDGDKQKIADAVKKARKQDLVLETDEVKLPDYMKAILLKALAKKPEDRFASAGEFAQALFEQVMPELAKRIEEEQTNGNPQGEPQGQDNSTPVITIKKGSGSGFDNVTGRNELKEQLRKEVLFALQNPEKAKAYKLPTINGVLLYGPPGCGKSLVLSSFAEELGYNYTIIRGPEMGHIYQEGVLDNLQRVFDAAEIKAPFVICIDELEFLAPNPNAEGEENVTPQISALYGMMNHCSKKGILVVATTNRPDLIDQSIMRIGCFDRVFFVPQPDFEARKDIFMAHLKDRPCEDIDFDELARMSDDFNAGDITEAVNEAAMTAAYNDVPISQKILVDVLKYKNPTYSTKTRIGFNKC